jgi:hypothetical protein
MAVYHVKFFKNLLSSEGHPFKVLQRLVNVRRSKTPERAAEAAQHRFERAEHVRNWKLHADTMEVETNDKSDHRRSTRTRKQGRS